MADSDKKPWRADLCETILFDINGTRRATLYFLADMLPLVVHEVFESNIKRCKDAVLGMSVEEFQANICTKVYNDPRWYPEGYPGLRSIGHFPLQEHLDKYNGAYLTIQGWGRLFMAIAEKDLDNLSQIFVMGADMYVTPSKYESRGCHPRADYFANCSKEMITRIKEEMDDRRSLDVLPEGFCQKMARAA